MLLLLRNRILSIGSHQVFNHSDSSFNIGSIEGTRTIYAWAKDSTGNIGGPFTDTITLDTQPPVLAILDGPEEYTNESTLTVSISLDGTSDLSLTGSCGVQSLTNQSTGSLDLGNLAEGTYSDCELEAFDLAANGSGIKTYLPLPLIEPYQPRHP